MPPCSLLNSCNPAPSSKCARRRRVQWWADVAIKLATFYLEANVRARKIFLAPLMAGALVLAACGGQNQETGGEEPAGEASVAPITSQDINEKDRADLAQGGEIRLDVAEFSTTWNIFSVNGNNDDMAHAMLPA